MVEPITLTTVATAVLTEGIKFLYGQASEALKAWRARQQKRDDAPAPAQKSANALEGKLDTSRLDFERMAALESELADLRNKVSYWADGIDPVDIGDGERLAQVEELRRVLERIYGQRITFKGERRPPTGTPIVEGKVEVREIAGTAVGVQTGATPVGRIGGTVRAGRIEAGGQAFGVRIGGGQGRPGTESDEK